MATNNSRQDFSTLMKMLQDKFPNFLLGLTVLLIIVLFVSVFFKKDQNGKTSANNWTRIFTGQKEEPTPTPVKKEKTYTVKDGDMLWTIAEAAYGSGYNAYDIAKANKLKDANLIEKGQILMLPSVRPDEPTKGEMVAGAMTGHADARPKTYTVQSGDYLSAIAEKYYGDGEMWVAIAKTNNLSDPNLIFSGNVLNLP